MRGSWRLAEGGVREYGVGGTRRRGRRETYLSQRLTSVPIATDKRDPPLAKRYRSPLGRTCDVTVAVGDREGSLVMSRNAALLAGIVVVGRDD